MNISVKIVKGKGRGKEILGFPTANAIVDPKTLSYPMSFEGKVGAWVVSTMFDGKKYMGTCGVCKKGDKYILETYILDFDGDLYDKTIHLNFLYSIRDQIIFKTLDESKEQLIKDIDFVRRYRSCDDCQLCVYQDYGYSNYTVEGTNVSCLAEVFGEYDQGYDNNTYVSGIATNCIYFSEGGHWSLDVDGESSRPSEEWTTAILREVKLKSILKKD